MQAELKEIPVGQLKPSPTNPRKHMGDLAELVASVLSKGVIEPIIARPNGKGFEIVCGHRRHAAATAARLETVPALVRELDDDEVLDLQLAENIDRADLSPLEEAEAYVLRLKRGQTLGHLAERIGRSPTYVAQRMALVDLTSPCREGLARGHISLGVAMLLCRIPDAKLQGEAFKDLAGDDDRPGVTLERARSIIEREYMLRLDTAPFDRTDPALVKDRPACSVCPQRTGNQTELFADVKSPDMCINATCFRSKLDAHWDRVVKAAKENGVKVLAAKDAKDVFNKWDDKPRYGSAWVALNDKVYTPGSGREVKVRSLVGKDAEITFGRNPHNGQIFELVPRKDVDKALKAKTKSEGKEREEKSRAKLTPQQRAAQERDKLKEKARAEVTKRCIAELVDQVESLHTNADEPLFRLILDPLLDAFYTGAEAAIARRGLAPEKTGKRAGGREQDPLVKAAAAMDVDQLRGLIAELAVGELEQTDTSGPGQGALAEAFAAFHVDVQRIEKEVLGELKAAREAAPTKRANGGKAKARRSPAATAH